MNALSDPMGVQVHRLANGLTVYLSENHELPRISARIAVAAGAAEDPPDRTGIAHYLEHMLANKGTRRLGTTDFAAESPHLDTIRDLYDRLIEAAPAEREALYARIDAAGLAASQFAIPNELKQAYGLLGARKLNAFTSHDQTAYVVDIPANRLEQWAMLEGDRFSAPVFRAFQTEVETVFEEKMRSLDDPGRRVSALTRAALWPDHPYGAEILGEIPHLQSPSISRMEQFYRRWYVPGNMAVILAGDFDSQHALRLIRAHLGQLPAAPVPARPARTVTPLAAPVRQHLSHPGCEELRLAWQTVPFAHPDRPALSLLDMLMDNRASGLLNRNLTIPQKVRSAGAFPSFMREAGAWFLYGQPRTGQSLEELESLLLAQLDRLLDGDFSDDDLTAILDNYELGYLKGLESNATRVGLMGQAFAHGLPWLGVMAELARLRAVSRGDILDVARRYLTRPHVTVLRDGNPADLPAPTPPPISGRTARPAAHSPFFSAVLSHPARPTDPHVLRAGEDWQRIERDGLRLMSCGNPHNDLFQLTWRLNRGRVGDPRWVVSMALLRRSGVGDMDHAALSEALYRMGVSMSVATSRHTTELRLSGRGGRLEEAVRLLRRRLSDPMITDTERSAHIEDAIAHRTTERAERGTLTRALQEHILHGADDSRFLGLSLSDDDLRALTHDDMRRRCRAVPGHFRIGLYAGPHDPQTVADLLGGGEEREPAIPAVRYAPVSGRRIVLVHHESAQSSIQLLCPRPPTPDRHLPMLLTEYLGGSAGLVFQEIRESRGMAYSAHASWGPSWRTDDETLMWASVGTQADKTPAVVALLLSLIAAPLDPRRLSRAHAGLLEKLRAARVTFRELPGVVERWHSQGHTLDPRPARLAALTSTTAEQLADFAAPLADAPLTVAIIGDTRRLDLAALRAILPVEERAADALFAY
jgi:predicted Zn-dependent peptidase